MLSTALKRGKKILQKCLFPLALAPQKLFGLPPIREIDRQFEKKRKEEYRKSCDPEIDNPQVVFIHKTEPPNGFQIREKL